MNIYPMFLIYVGPWIAAGVILIILAVVACVAAAFRNSGYWSQDEDHKSAVAWAKQQDEAQGRVS